MKKLLFFIFFSNFIFNTTEVNSQSYDNIIRTRKFNLTDSQEKLAQKLSKSADYIARNEVTDKLQATAREEAYKNKNLQYQNKIKQYQAILNNKTLSPIKIKDSLEKLGLVFNLNPDANMVEFARLTKKINTSFPELNSLSKEFRLNVIARADQLILNNKDLSKAKLPSL